MPHAQSPPVSLPSLNRLETPRRRSQFCWLTCAQLYNEFLPIMPLFSGDEMSKIEVVPALPEYSPGPPPHYNVTAAATEQVIVPAAYVNASSLSLSPTGPTIDHTVHSNPHIFVILAQSGHIPNRQRSPPMPAYGRRATISGSLSLASGRWTSTISKVAVSLKGRASSVLIQRGMRQPAASKKLFFISRTLWKKTAEYDKNSLDNSMKFEFTFPESITGERENLPPTFDEETQMVFGIATRVKVEYSLRIDVWRQGLWGHKR